MPSPRRRVAALAGLALAACAAREPAPSPQAPGPSAGAPAGADSSLAPAAPTAGALAAGASASSVPAASASAAGASAVGAPTSGAPAASAPAASAPAAASAAPARRLETRDLVGLWLISEKSYEDAGKSVDAKQHRADGVYRWGKYDHKRKVFTPARVETRSPGFVMRWELDAERGEFVVHNDGADEHVPVHLDGPGRVRTVYRDSYVERTIFHLKID